ncbi:hypothetical protein [Actinoplanes sp. NPDC051494]|uniref:hypothetical protein n=1 Tax=Actinoplanes sp. NPDC051494 TaxID=3363907 RepID=UPI00379DF456
MSDDRIQQGLDAYADHLQHTTAPAPAREIRHRAARRRRNRTAAGAFVAALVVAGGLGAVLNRPSGPPVVPAASPSASASASGSARTSDVSQLRELGIDLETAVLLDIADDGVDRWMQAGAGDVVDFTGTARDATTEMELRPAPVSARNRVTIALPARPGMCVAATTGVTLTLTTCRDGDATQTWRVVPAGDSGQFELEGSNGILRVEDGRLVAPDRSGRTGIQTLR